MSDLDDLCMEVWTPKNPIDIEEAGDMLGYVYMFGYKLSADEADSFARYVAEQALAARVAEGKYA